MSAAGVLLMPYKALQWMRIASCLFGVRRAPGDEKRLQQLTKLLAAQRGLAMKGGQIFAGATGASPLEPLVTSVEPLSLKRIRPVLEARFKRPLDEIFVDIEESCAAASLGQVHRATLRDGRSVALKVRYPGIAAQVRADLGLMARMPAAGPARRWQFDLPGYKASLERQVLRELDYRIEADTQSRLRTNLEIRGLTIPEVVSELCSERLLVQSWESGVRFDQACHWSKAERLEIGRILITTLFRGLFVLGEVHGDPHMGNYLFQRHAGSGPRVVLLDFGCTVRMDDERRRSLLTLLLACRSGKPFDIGRCFAELGFDPEKLGWITDELPELCRILFKPFLSPRPFHCREWRLNDEMNQLLQERKWWFRTAAPAELFPWMRIFHGLIGQLNALDVALPWWPLLEHCLDEELLAEAQQTIPAPARPAKTGLASRSGKDANRILRIQIEVADKTPSILDFPAHADLDLKSFMPREVYAKLVSTGYAGRLNELQQALQNRRLDPRLLFDMRIEEKRIRAWIV